MYDANLIAETKRELMSKGVRYCLATYVDVHGVPKAKTSPIDTFEKMVRGSELFTVGAMEGMGLVGPQEDECAAVPDLSSMMILPWDKRFAWFALKQTWSLAGWRSSAGGAWIAPRPTTRSAQSTPVSRSSANASSSSGTPL